MRKKILKIYGIGLTVGGLYYLFTQLTGLAIPCFYVATTGFQCPGCGLSRMFVSLFHLELADAFSYNPVCFVLLFCWLAISGLCFWGKPAFVRNRHFLYPCFYVSVAALIIYGILRNFP